MTTGRLSVDVQMPLKHGQFIRGDVVQRLLAQDVALTWFVDAGPDLEIGAADRALLDVVSSGPFWANHMTYMARILAKRNRLLGRGQSQYTYIADADVTLPRVPIWPALLQALEHQPSLGAVGAIYAVDWPHARYHLGTGSMMLRRDDLDKIGPLRGAPCECTFIRLRLASMGKHVVPLTRLHAHQWKRTLLDDGPLRDQKEGACPLCGEERCSVPDDALAEVRVDRLSDGSLPLDRLRTAVERHGLAFKLYVDA